MQARPPPNDLAIAYRQKLCSMREAVDLVRVDDTIAATIAGGQPAEFLTALAERDDWRSLTLFSGLLIAPYPVLQHPGVTLDQRLLRSDRADAEVDGRPGRLSAG